jgi:hypothetical protein
MTGGTALWLNGDGASSLPLNRRATRYAFGQSEASSHHATDLENRPTGYTAP